MAGQYEKLFRPRNPACWVESDSYDRAALAEIVSTSPSAQRIVDKGKRLAPHFGALVQDLFSLFFKYNLVYRREEEMLPSARLNRTLLRAVEEGPAYDLLRSSTLLEQDRAGLATILIAEEVVKILQSERMLTRAELLELWRLNGHEGRVVELSEEARSAEELASRRAIQNKCKRDARRAQPFREAERQARARLRALAAQSAYALKEVPGGVREQLSSLPGRVHASVQGAAEHLQSWERALGGAGRRSGGTALELGWRLARNTKLRKLASLVGRMREMALALRRRVLERSNEEVYEIRQGSELGRLLPHELVRLLHPGLREDFRRRLVEAELLLYGLSGSGRRGRGPMVVCLDGSGSMAGDKELWSKAVALTLLEIARRQRRGFQAICFSSAETPLRVIDLGSSRGFGVDAAQAMDLAEYFPGGGTDFELPLDAAVKSIRRHRLKSADLVLITDGECRVSSEWLDCFRQEKQRLGFSLYSVLVDTGPSFTGTLLQISDRITSISQLTAEGAKKIFLDL